MCIKAQNIPQNVVLSEPNWVKSVQNGMNDILRYEGGGSEKKLFFSTNDKYITLGSRVLPVIKGRRTWSPLIEQIFLITYSINYHHNHQLWIVYYIYVNSCLDLVSSIIIWGNLQAGEGGIPPLPFIIFCWCTTSWI